MRYYDSSDEEQEPVKGTKHNYYFNNNNEKVECDEFTDYYDNNNPHHFYGNFYNKDGSIMTTAEGVIMHRFQDGSKEYIADRDKRLEENKEMYDKMIKKALERRNLRNCKPCNYYFDNNNEEIKCDEFMDYFDNNKIEHHWGYFYNKDGSIMVDAEGNIMHRYKNLTKEYEEDERLRELEFKEFYAGLKKEIDRFDCNGILYGSFAQYENKNVNEIVNVITDYILNEVTEADRKTYIVLESLKME